MTAVASPAFPFIDARRYGAKGDGVADDQPALAAAVAAAAALPNGGTVVLPLGTCRLATANGQGSALTIPARVKMLGLGEGMCTLQRASTAIGNVIGVTGDYVTLEGFTLDGGLSGFAAGASHGISAQNVNHFRARRLFTTNYLNTAILCQGTPAQTYRDAIIKDCVCDGLGVANNGHLIVAMDESGIEDCTARGIPGSPGYGNQLKNGCRYCWIDNCRAINCSGGNVFGRDSSPGVSHSRMTGVTSIACDGGVLMGDAVDNVITGAKIHMTGNVNDAIRLQQASVGNVISGVQISGVGASRGAVRFDDTAVDNMVTLDSVDCAGAGATVVATGSADRNTIEVKKYVNQPTHELSTSTTGTQNRVRRVEDRHMLYEIGLGAVIESFDRKLASAALVMAPNLPYYIPVYLEAGEIITNVTLHVSALTGAPTNFFVGLYKASSGAQVAVSADQAAAVTATGQKVLPLTAAYTVLDSGHYYVALLQVGGVLSPLGSASSTAARLGSNPFPYAQDTNAAATVLPSPNLAIAAGTKAFWTELS